MPERKHFFYGRCSLIVSDYPNAGHTLYYYSSMLEWTTLCQASLERRRSISRLLCNISLTSKKNEYLLFYRSAKINVEAPCISKLNYTMLVSDSVQLLSKLNFSVYFQEVSHPKGAQDQWINLAAQAQPSWQPIILQQNK